MKRILAIGLVAAFIAVAGLVYAGPGRGCCGNGPGTGPGTGPGAGGWYDPAKAETIQGQVVSVEQVAARRGPGAGVIVKLTTGSETIAVHLGPSWFLDKQEMKIAAGDTVAVTGVKTMRRGQDVFLAGEVKKDGAVLKLRDDQGVPVWAGWRRANNPS
jgi:hypothetical protein